MQAVEHVTQATERIMQAVEYVTQATELIMQAVKHVAQAREHHAGSGTCHKGYGT